MSILIFIIVLGILIFVHELGHFIFAKKTGMLVEEFAIGFPPRAFSFKKGETKYSIGLIPIGGFVKIYGEEYGEDGSKKSKNYNRRFTNRPRWAQAIVLIAGVSFNFLLAWVFISIGFMSGLPVSVDQFEGEVIEDQKLVLVDVLPDSPASQAGLKPGDVLLYLETKGSLDSIQGFEDSKIVEDFIFSHGGHKLEILYKRGSESILAEVTPEEGIVDGKPAIGVSFGMIGNVKFPFLRASWEGLKTTFSLTIATAVGLYYFITGLVVGSADLSQVSGPVGIISMVGDAFNFGFVYLLSFVALISINLAVINLIPIPALDGGRLLFVLIEAIKGSPIKARIANWLNLIGFAALILFMLFITFSDILKFF
ncbi:MAG: RIP metalloprotease RseP [Patescibacteria group bacterium]|nr:RIP metalloprotease RseP [Patescibacteria group bacterium]